MVVAIIREPNHAFCDARHYSELPFQSSFVTSPDVTLKFRSLPMVFQVACFQSRRDVIAVTAEASGSVQA